MTAGCGWILERLDARECPSSAGWWVPGVGGGMVRVRFLDPAEFVSIGGGYAVFADGADAATTRELAAYFAPVADVVRVTNVRPVEPRYTDVRFGADLPEYAGLAPVGGVRSFAVPVALVAYPGTSPTAAVVAAHEVGHVFGLGHDADPDSIMYGGDLRVMATLPTPAGLSIRATLAME